MTNVTPPSVLTAGNSVYKRRSRINKVMLTLSSAALIFGLFWLFWIILTLLVKGASALSFTLFLEPTPPPGGDGGLLNAILGSLMMAGVGTLIGTPIG
ncbi:MAG TPA: phosphate ABC transporter permease PtsA, partial [Paenalcaligenes sp.]|nr:phosphate ABC transporter permease PtsA [Paenalcaligenes sp.]